MNSPLRVSGTNTSPFPFVSVIVPVFNEERYIDECLESILHGDFPPERMEVIVVDGMSTDNTRARVEQYVARDQRVRLLLNPRRRQPFAMNIGVRAARGDVIVRIDGHSRIRPSHVRQCVEYLLSSGADHVGGISRATGRSYVAQAIAMAMTSPFGVGSARFRYTTRERAVEHVPWGAYTREILDRLGGFDETFLNAQDSEFDFRIVKSGGTIRVTPDIVTEYWCRDSLRGLAKQYFNYGRYRALTCAKHRSVPSVRVVMPACMVAVLSTLSLLSPASPAVRRLLRLMLVLYGITSISAAFYATRGNRRQFPLLPVVFGTMHLSHGIGFLSSLLPISRRVLLLARHDPTQPRVSDPSHG